MYKNMKKMFFFMPVFLLVGAGCVNTAKAPVDTTMQPKPIEATEQETKDTKTEDTNEVTTAQPTTTEMKKTETTETKKTEPVAKPKPTPPATQTVKEFKLTAKQWSFSPSTIMVNKGDKVRLTVQSVDVNHGFAISEFGIDRTLSPGKTEVIEFTADKAGTFSFFCSEFCGSGHAKMKGTLIVK